MQQAKGKGDGRVGRFPHPGGRLRSAGAAIVAGLSVLLSGCGLTSGPSTLTPDAPSTMTVTSAAFGQGVLPQRYTCHGAKISPPLDWSGAPSGTRSYAIVVDDSTVDLIAPYIRWIVFDIPQATTDIQEGQQLPPGTRQADNSIGQAGYDPPCPGGHDHQSYRFTVYALRSTLKLPNGASTLSAWTAIANAAIARGRTAAVANP